MPEASSRRTPDPAAVQVQVERLIAVDDEALAGAFSDHLWWLTSAVTADGEPVHDISDDEFAEQAAYRAPALAARALKAVRRAQQSVHETVPRQPAEDEQAWQRRVRRYLSHLEREEVILQTVVAGLKAQRGIIATPRNPRRRAEHRLAQMNLAQDLPKGTIVELTQQEKRVAKRR
ncbi:hypothetical protein GCM10027586_09010 [Kineococcus gypseus]|uniref:hypothetical protein n=1 Tax=Kineococcus gypseus TaxID=1637102 RepID=UPI003D7EAA69